jgi:hypothetical protein
METKTKGRLRQAVGAVSRFGAPDDSTYQGIIFDGPETDKLVALADALLFYCQVARLKTHPVKITEAEGCVTLWWSWYVPAAFRGSRLLALVAGGELIDHLTVQESAVA